MQPEGYMPVVLLARSASATENVFGLYVPGATPKEVVAKLNAMVSAVLDTPDIAEKLSRQGLQPMGGTLEHPARPAGAGTVSQQQPRVSGSAKAAPAQSSSPTRTQSAATVAAVAAAPSADFDGFDAELPYTEHYKYTCGTRPGEAMVPAESPNNCIAEQKRFMAIQCFPGWLMHETNIARFRCAADKSRGAPKAAWLNKLKGAQEFVRRNAPECNAETGCQGNIRLGNN